MAAAPALRARCPAKVNLGLRVLGPRADGYHELDTLFQTIDLWDELGAEGSSELRLWCDDPAVPVDDSNLVLRAARLLLARCGTGSLGACLRLEKRIPVQGGLGGGSSNAAGALRLCARLWGLRVEEEVLLALAAELGADVPFFLVGGTARGRGRGDRIERLPPWPPTALLLGCPPFGVPTREVFGRLRLQWTGPRLTLPEGPGDAGVSGFAVNDLEPVVYEGWPELARFREALLVTGARVAMLSGSGSTVFGTFPDEVSASSAAARLAPLFPSWRLEVTRTIQAAAALEPLD